MPQRQHHAGHAHHQLRQRHTGLHVVPVCRREHAAKDAQAHSNSCGGANQHDGNLAGSRQVRWYAEKNREEPRQQSREDDFFANLEAKYARKGKKVKRSAEDEPPEEAFQKNQARRTKKSKS